MDEVFAKFDKDNTGEIEHDELTDNLTEEIMPKYMERLKTRGMEL